MPRRMLGVVVVLVGSLYAQIASAQDQSALRTLQTDGMRNGRIWRILTVQQHEAFVFAYGEGALLGLIIGCGSDREKYNRLSKDLWPSGMTYDEIVESLDRLFDIPENRSIAISDAIHLAAERKYGKDEKQIQEELLGMRQRANQ